MTATNRKMTANCFQLSAIAMIDWQAGYRMHDDHLACELSNSVSLLILCCLGKG